MTYSLARRRLLTGGLALLASAGAARAGIDDWIDEDGNFIENPALRPEATPGLPGSDFARPESDIRDPSLLPPPESPIDFPIEPADLSKIPRQFRKQIVAYNGPEWPGTIIIDPRSRHLYLVLGDGEAISYGVGVGRAGFEWSGRARVGMKRRWPRWLPPLEMVARDKNAAKWVNGQPGGPKNPLGARALYLYSNGADTFYRIHGTNDPSSIGKAMSSGCIRMLNEDVADLYLRVPVGSEVVVLGPNSGPAVSVSTN
jgi:lipoprotein-anchoring transpeptidase ErfK/SrfK